MKDNSGPAFPVSMAPVVLPDGSCLNDGFTNEGMTLRDYFAGHALAGVIACPVEGGFAFVDYAKHAYAIADMMIAERAK